MALTAEQKAGVEAAILEYLVAEGGRFARTVMNFQEEMQLPPLSPPANAEPTMLETLTIYGLQTGYHLKDAVENDNMPLVKQLTRVFVAFEFDEDGLESLEEFVDDTSSALIDACNGPCDQCRSNQGFHFV